MFFKNPACLVAVSGVSGTGKTSLIEKLEAHFEGVRVITYTTRVRRDGELPSAYHFCSRAGIQRLPYTLWVRENYDNLYAVTASGIYAPLTTHGIALLPTITSHHQTLSVLSGSMRYIGVHLLSADRVELAERMTVRGDSPADIQKRLQQITRIDAKAQGLNFVHCLKPDSAAEIFTTVLHIIAKEPS